MMIGHYGPALALHRFRPSVPLWVYFVAVQIVDVFWGVFILTGVEHARIVPGFTESNALDLYDMPYTHGVLSSAMWALVAGLGWALARRAPSRWLEGLMVAAAVASHFIADLLVHVHDLPLWRGDGEKLGFGLWQHRELAMVVELAFFALPALVWLRSAARRSRKGRRFAMLAAMTAFLIASFYAPTPPTPQLMAATALAIMSVATGAAAWATRAQRTTASRVAT